MSRASRRSQQVDQLLGALPPERAGPMVGLGVLYAPVVIILDLALAAVLSRSVLRGWRARHEGVANAVRAGVDPALIGLIGALTVNEVVRALVFRTMIRPALDRAAPHTQRAQPGDP